MGQITHSSPRAHSQLQRIIRVVTRHHPVVSTWNLVPLRGGFELQWTQEGQSWKLIFEPGPADASYAESASCSVSIRSDQPIQGLLPPVEAFVQTLVELLQRADTGDWVFPSTPSPSGEESSWEGRDTESARQAHIELADTLHFASYVAYRAVTSADLYPHINPLGDPVDAETLRKSWAQTLADQRVGKAPQKLGLYIHIPYCAVACTFCYCSKTDRFSRGDFDSYLQRLEEEIRFFAPAFEDAHFTSVYFGGGTPSLLSPPAMERLFGRLYEAYDVSQAEQIIFEGNPDSLTERKISILASQGQVTRLTIGVQTLDDEAQRRAKRFNKHHHVREAVAAAREHGIPHINIDLMAGMDGQSVQSFKDDVCFVLELQPDSMNLNGFRPVPGTAWFEAGHVMTEAQIAGREEMLGWGFDQLASAGLVSQRAVDPGITRNAANIQEYNLRRQNSSLLGLGFPSRSHAFGQWFYEPDAAEGMDPSLAREQRQERRWMGFPMDHVEERHKFLVDNLVTGFEISEFVDLFGIDPWDAAGTGLNMLERLGVLRRVGDVVETDHRTHVDALIYRVLLYGEIISKRIEARWRPDYDRSVDYRARMDRLIARKG